MKRNTPLKRTGFANKREPMKQVSDKKSLRQKVAEFIYPEAKEPQKPRRSINPISQKRRNYRASKEGQDALAYMLAVKALPCCVCGAPAPSEAHHVIHDRYGTRKASDYDTIPLCASCHRVGPNAIHNGKEIWRKKHGPDHGFIEQTQIAILGKVRDG